MMETLNSFILSYLSSFIKFIPLFIYENLFIIIQIIYLKI